MTCSSVLLKYFYINSFFLLLLNRSLLHYTWEVSLVSSPVKTVWDDVQLLMQLKNTRSEWETKNTPLMASFLNDIAARHPL